MKAVIMDNIPLDYGPWLNCSPECLDFLKGLLMRDPAQRMTATEALEHPWFRRHFGEPILPLCSVRFWCCHGSVGDAAVLHCPSSSSPSCCLHSSPRAHLSLHCADAEAANGARPSRNNIVPLIPGAPRCSFYSSCASSVLRSLPV